MTHTLSAEIEKVLQETIFPDLEKGRKDFDLPHTKAVVFWMKKLLDSLPPTTTLNQKVLITAAYAHDWGYIGLFDGMNSNDPAEIKKRKPLHMERGSQLIMQLLQNKLPTLFSPEEIRRTAHLVLIHDLVEKVTDEDEVLLMEADTLGMLDTDLVTPTFSLEDNTNFMKYEIYERRLRYFTHEIAKNVVKGLAEKRTDFYLTSKN